MASLPNVNNAGAMPAIQLNSINDILIDMSKMLSDKLGDISKMIKMDSSRDKKEQSLTAAAEARQKALDAENKRESMFSKKSSLGKGASTVGSALGKSITGGGALQALLGGAILAAIFAPEKMKSVLKAIGKGVEDLLDNKWLMKNVDEFIAGLNLTNLFSFMFLGLRGGLVVAAFKYAGEQLADLLGFKAGDDTGEATLGSEIKDYVRKAIIGAASGLGIFAFLFPGLFFKGMLGVAKGASNLIAASWGAGMTSRQAGAIGAQAAAGRTGFLAKIKTSLFGTVTGVSSGITSQIAKDGGIRHGPNSTGKQGDFMSKADRDKLTTGQSNFKRGILSGPKGKAGLIGIALAAMAAVAAVLILGDGENKKTAEDAGDEMKKGLNLMSTGLEAAAEGAMAWAGTGAMIGMMFGPIGLVIGTVVGGLLGAAIGILSLSDEEKEKFAKGIATVWDSMIEKFTKMMADMLAFLLPSFMIPDWVKKAKSTEQEKVASSEAAATASAANVVKAQNELNLTPVQKELTSKITGNMTPTGKYSMLNQREIRAKLEEVPGLNNAQRNRLTSKIYQNERNKEDVAEDRANIGAEERGLTSEINDFQKEIDKEKVKVVEMEEKDAAVRARIIGEVDPGGVMDPADIEKMMVGHKDKNEAEIKKSEKRIAALQEGKIAAQESQLQVIAKEDSSGGIRSRNIAIGKEVNNTALMEFLSSSGGNVRDAQLIAMQVMGESVQAADSGRMLSDPGGMRGGQGGGSSTTTQNVSTSTTNYQSGIPMFEMYRMRTSVGRLVAGGSGNLRGM